jgi:hypothetical protein
MPVKSSCQLLLHFLLFTSLQLSPVYPEVVKIATVHILEDLPQAFGLATGVSVETIVGEHSHVIRMVAGGKADFTLILDPLLPAEQVILGTMSGRRGESYPLGWIAATWLVHPTNPLPTLPLQDVQAIFSTLPCLSATQTIATASSQQSLGKLMVLLPNPGTIAWKSLVSCMERSCNPTSLRVDAQYLLTEAGIERMVGNHPSAIGATTRLRSFLSARTIPISVPGNPHGILPTQETLRLNLYPFSREIILVCNQRFPAESPPGKLFNYVLSEQGGETLPRLGLFPR